MYSSFQLFKKYLHYYLTASNGKGHGIHSPFVFDFIKNVLNEKKVAEKNIEIEIVRNKLLHDNSTIKVEDFGAGSGIIKTNNRFIKKIAASSLKPKKYAALIASTAKYYGCKTIVELGTSFGITTAYMAAANVSSVIYTLEGSASISAIANETFNQLHLKNIQLIKGEFEKTLPALLSTLDTIDLAFIDGNHKKIPTLAYLEMLLAKHSSHSIFIFDDIYWSEEMEAAWKEIQEHPEVTLTIDLFFIGLVFFNKDFKVKQHFKIRF